MARRPREKNPSWIDENIPPELANSALLRFDAKIPDGTVISIDLLQDVDVDYERLESQLADTPSQYIWYASVLAEIKAQVQILERKCKARRGYLTEQAVAVAASAGVRSPAADVVKVMIESDETLNKLEAILANNQKHANKIHHMVEALRMKSEHLRSLAGFKRQERETQR